MGVMDGLKQAADVLRAADKLPEFNAILDAQQKIFDLQNQNQKLKEELAKEKQANILVFEKDHMWMIDPEEPDRKLCPTCSQKLRIKQPLRGHNCYVCSQSFR